MLSGPSFRGCVNRVEKGLIWAIRTETPALSRHWWDCLLSPYRGVYLPKDCFMENVWTFERWPAHLPLVYFTLCSIVNAGVRITGLSYCGIPLSLDKLVKWLNVIFLSKYIFETWCCLLQSSPSTGSSSVIPFSSGLNPATQCKSSGDKPVGPKCGACGEIGHNKNSKICPQYFSEEAVQRREVLKTAVK